MKVLVIGAGDIGSYVGRILIEDGHQVKFIEKDAATFKAIKENHPDWDIHLGGGTNPETLDEVQASQADVMCLVTADDVTNLIAGVLGKMEYGIERVIARVNEPQNQWLFEKEISIDDTVNQAEIMGRLIIQETSMADMLTMMQIKGGDLSIVSYTVSNHAQVVGKTLTEIDLPDESLILAIHRAGKSFIPNGATILETGDEVMALSDESSLKELYKLMR